MEMGGYVGGMGGLVMEMGDKNTKWATWNPELSIINVIIVVRAERSKLFIEDQAFLQSYDSAPGPPPSCPASKLTLFLRLPVCRRSSLLMRYGEGVFEKPNQRPRESLILYKSFNTLCIRMF